ncbi:peptidase inhibitor family I36 protein [Streptomyces sp. NPDC006393]|uniref:peptidase inhibitor family I36 protein n=1 Tax=Streptomyces sp. NPDC006393 TaxID=3156763 RepID=UPI0033E6FC8B
MIISRVKRTLPRPGHLLTVGLALLCSLLFVLPAKADPAPFDDCPSDTLCLYSGSDGSGDRRDFTESGNAESYDATWDGKTLSAKNNTKLWACVYVGTGYGGLLQTIKPANSDEYSTDSRFAGTISSHKLVPSRAHCFTGYERCPDNRVCTFTEPNGRGTMTVHRPATDTATKNYGNSYGSDVAPVSVWNRTRKHVCFYPEPDFTGTWTDPADGQVYGAYVVLRGDSTTVPAPFAGTFRSHELVNGTSECQ